MRHEPESLPQLGFLLDAALRELLVEEPGPNGQAVGAVSEAIGRERLAHPPHDLLVRHRRLADVAVEDELQLQLRRCKEREKERILREEKLDVTLPGRRLKSGHTHPITSVMDEIIDIFWGMGFEVARGPDIEDDYHNFEALNFPKDHPARDMQDTFFVRKSNKTPTEDLVLRTHTSPVQIRLMKEKQPPIRSIMPGRVYRNEAVTAKSYFQFNQVEGLYVNERVTLGELIETLVMFARLMYGSDVKYRVRPSFFPFTEPSMEMDIWWENEKGGQWLEILGAGMVDPNVFDAVGVDSEAYTGFAFGMGVDRIAMLRYGIDDIRTLYENDIRFLEQFPSS